MQCHHCPKKFFDKSDFQTHRRSHSDRQHQIRIANLGGIGAVSLLRNDGEDVAEARRPRKTVFQASILPPQWKTSPISSSLDVRSDISSFQDALLKFPTREVRMSIVSEISDMTCQDCDAVFSSGVELNQHYLTKFCPGAAIVVYAMVRDRFIKKGYRIEKRLIPFHSHPISVPCGKCPQIFHCDEAKDAHESLHHSDNLLCEQCGKLCDTVYEFKIHYDFHEDMEFRHTHYEAENASTKSQSRFVQTRNHFTSGAKATATATELVLKKLGRRSSQIIFDTWPLKKCSQSVEQEVFAISFSLPEDLEQVHAPEGILQEADPPTIVDHSVMEHITWLDLNEAAPNLRSPKQLDEDVKSATVPYADHKLRPSADGSRESGCGVGNIPIRKPSILKRTILSLKLPKRLSLRRTTLKATSRRKLIKRDHVIRFSFVATGSKADRDRDRSQDRGQMNMNSHTVVDVNDTGEQNQSGQMEVEEQNEQRDPYIHVRHSTGGVVIEDAAGRQRVLEMEQVASLVSIINGYFEALPLRSKVEALQTQAAHNLRIGHPKTAMSAYNDALEILYKNSVLDLDLTLRASILHRLGYVYYILGQTDESETCYLEALAIYRRVFGREYALNFTILNDLAILCGQDGYATEAAELYERALSGRLRVLGSYAPETLSTMQELAMLRVSLGNLESAVSLFEEVVPALEAVHGPKHEKTLDAMNSLAVLYQKLGLNEQSLEVSLKMIPHCKVAMGSNHHLTRAAVTRYVQETKNFDFTVDIKKLLEQYRGSRNPENLRVLQALGRSHMSFGLNRDACILFESLFDDLSTLRGQDSLESFDALSGLCVAYENIGVLDSAIQAYEKLIQIAEKTPKDHPCRGRMEYARKRVMDLQQRGEVLVAERRAWNLQDEGPCSHCRGLTSSLCKTCHILRFCGDACWVKYRQYHQPSCIPSVTVRESKSVVIAPKCPTAIQNEALINLTATENGLVRSHGSSTGTSTIAGTTPTITASHTVYMDPRNFTTFRLKLSSSVNTLLIFCTEADVRYTVLGNISGGSEDYDIALAVPPPIPRGREQRGNNGGRTRYKRKPLTMSAAVTKKDKTPKNNNKNINRNNKTKQNTNRTPPTSWGTRTSTLTTTPSAPSTVSGSLPITLDWLTPLKQESVCITTMDQPSGPVYLVVAPGQHLMQSTVKKRLEARSGGGDKEKFEALVLPDTELIEYSQGLLLNGYIGEAFMYIIEWI